MEATVFITEERKTMSNFLVMGIEFQTGIQALGDYIKPVATKPANVTPDQQSQESLFKAELPIVQGNLGSREALKQFARVITTKTDEGGINFLSFQTETSKRAHFFYPFIFKVKDTSKSAMSAVMFKGTGSLAALEKYGSPFAQRQDGIEGSANIKDLRLDAANSKILDGAGIRTREALAVFTLDMIDYQGKVYTSQELLDKGIVKSLEDLPGIGVFASRTALRIEDVKSIIQHNDLDSPLIAGLITSFIRTTEFDDSRQFTQFFQKWKGSVGKGKTVPLEVRREILSDYSLAIAGVLGSQAAKFEKAKIVKFTDTSTAGEVKEKDVGWNVSCLGESIDNSQLFFNATTKQMSEFQDSLMDMTSLVPEVVGGVTLKHESINRFLDSYLDEMIPNWRELPVPDDFMETETYVLDVDQNTVKRAFSVTKIKLRAKIEELGSGVKPKYSDFADLLYNPLSYILRDDHVFTKSSKFLKDYLGKFGYK